MRSHEIVRFKILRTARIVALVYAIVALPDAVIIAVIARRIWQVRAAGTIFYIVGVPIWAALVTFIVTAFLLSVYNFCAARVGGIAFELTPRSEN